MAAGQDGHDGHDEAPLDRAVVRSLTKMFSASGEAILGTQRYLEQCAFLIQFFRASGGAILGTQRWLYRRSFPSCDLSSTEHSIQSYTCIYSSYSFASILKILFSGDATF